MDTITYPLQVHLQHIFTQKKHRLLNKNKDVLVYRGLLWLLLEIVGDGTNKKPCLW